MMLKLLIALGTLGAAMARVLLDRTGCSEPLARGVAAASAAHGMATAALGTAEPEVGGACPDLTSPAVWRPTAPAAAAHIGPPRPCCPVEDLHTACCTQSVTNDQLACDCWRQAMPALSGNSTLPLQVLGAIATHRRCRLPRWRTRWRASWPRCCARCRRCGGCCWPLPAEAPSFVSLSPVTLWFVLSTAN
jgi:LrgB-like family